MPRRDPDHSVFVASRRLIEILDLPDPIGGSPVNQLIWATVVRSKLTFEAILLLLTEGFDVQAAMLSRSLFEDMVVAHWIAYNRADSGWLIDRFFRHREAMALDQIEMLDRYQWGTGPLLVSDEKTLRRKQNDLKREFKGRARQDWWDPGEEGRGVGKPMGLQRVAEELEEAAAKHECFHPRFAGGEQPMLMRMEAVMNKWYSRQLHHTAVGLPVQPNPIGPATPNEDVLAPWRMLFVAYWMFGQQLYLLLEHAGLDQLEHAGFDPMDYNALFQDGLKTIGHFMGSWVAGESGLTLVDDVASGSRVLTAAEVQGVGRNDPCPCGSGRKFKRCHGA